MPVFYVQKCQTVAKERYKGSGETHKPIDMRAVSPFWLRGVMTCDKCGSARVGNSTSSKVKGGRKRYYVCDGYMRKGKFLFLRGLEQEIKNSFNERNPYKLAVKENPENKVSFLLKRVQSIEEDIQTGKAKSYHHDMLSEMNKDLHKKTKELNKHSKNYKEIRVPEELVASIKYDLQAFLGLLDQEVPNVQLLQSIAKKSIHKLRINRDTEKLYFTLRLPHEQNVVYEKTIVAGWQ